PTVTDDATCPFCAPTARSEGGERFGQLGLAEAAGVGAVHSRHHARIQDVRKRGEKGSLTLNTTAASWPVSRRQAGRRPPRQRRTNRAQGAPIDRPRWGSPRVADCRAAARAVAGGTPAPRRRPSRRLARAAATLRGALATRVRSHRARGP